MSVRQYENKDKAMRTGSFMQGNGWYCNADILGGISDAQWQAFTIEEEFSKCKLTAPVSHLQANFATANAPTSVIPESNRISSEINSGKETDVTLLNIDKILDKELLRIFMKYEATQKTDGNIVDKNRLDFCAGLIGRSLKKNAKNYKEDLVQEDVDVRNSTENGSGDFSMLNHDERPEHEHELVSCVKDVQMGQRKVGWYQELRPNNVFQSVNRNGEGETWPLLKDIMQLSPEASPRH